jgi:alkylation response protein AidB-like acyl-CoA dehydrogenase
MDRNIEDLFLYPKLWMGDDSRDVAALVRQWADKEIISRRMEYRENYDKQFAEKRKKLNIDIGLQRLMIPEDLGGFGWNSPSKAPGVLAVTAEIGRADASIGAIAAIQHALLSTIAMEHNFNRGLCEKLAPMYTGEDLRTPALILPGPGIAGKETALFLGRSMLAHARSADSGYAVSGQALRPLFAGKSADLFCTVCAAPDGRPCIAILPGDSQGIQRGSPFYTTGLNAWENADVTFHNVPVANENIIDRPGTVEGLYVWLNLLLGGVSVGAGTHFFEILSDWSETRVISGGTTLKENPLCASVLADVAEEIALAGLLLFSLARIIAGSGLQGDMNPAGAFTYAEMIGARVQQAVMKAINRGMELMGSAGYAKEWHVEKLWRDVKTIQSLLCGVAAEAPVKMDTARFFCRCTEI